MQRLSYPPPVTAKNQPMDLFFPECKTSIPPEVINHIFLRLSAYELIPLKAVSKVWKKVLFSNPEIVSRLKLALECLNNQGDLTDLQPRDCDQYYSVQFNRSRLLGIHSVILKYPLSYCKRSCTVCVKKFDSFINYWGKADYNLTKDAVLTLEEESKSIFIQYLINFALEISCDETIELLDAISVNYIKKQMLRNITHKFLDLTKNSLKDSERLIQKFTDEPDKFVYLEELVKNQLPVNRNEAKRISEQILDPKVKLRVDLGIVKFDACCDLNGTKSFIKELENSEFKDRALKVIIELECLIDLHAAKETVKLIESDYIRGQAMLAIVIAEASINVSEAKKTIEWFSNATYRFDLYPYRNLALLNIAKIEVLQDPANAKKTVELITDPAIKRLTYLLMADPKDRFALNRYQKILADIPFPT